MFITSASVCSRPYRDDQWPRRPPIKPTFRGSASSQEKSGQDIGQNNSFPRGPSNLQANRDPNYSLLAELFPQEVERSTAQVKTARKIRRIPLNPIDVGPSELAKNDDIGGRQEAASDREVSESLHALVLKKAGKSLEDEDFRRLVPGDSHLEGWSSKEVLLKVIRGRDGTTLEPNGNYYILFRTARAARSYMNRAKEVHALSQRYSPSSDNLSPPIAPPPLAIPESSDSIEDFPKPQESLNLQRSDPFSINASLSTSISSLTSYTLVPPTQRLDLSFEDPPFSPMLQQLFSQDGYSTLVNGRVSETEVMLTVDGTQPSLHHIRSAIREDNRQRRMRWNINGSLKGIRELRMPQRSQLQDQSEVDENLEPKEQLERPHWERKGWKIWIVSCNTVNEAKRFVSAWHRRNIRPLLGSNFAEGDDIITSAEIIT